MYFFIPGDLIKELLKVGSYGLKYSSFNGLMVYYKTAKPFIFLAYSI